jgi:hypothetical protein
VEGALLSACIGECPKGSATCFNACFTKYSKSQPAYDALLGCVRNFCPECQ